MIDLIDLARQKANRRLGAHWDGCEAVHIDCLLTKLAGEIERLRVEVERLRGCRDELRQVTEAMDDPRVHNTMTLVEAVRELVGKRDAR